MVVWAALYPSLLAPRWPESESCRRRQPCVSIVTVTRALRRRTGSGGAVLVGCPELELSLELMTDTHQHQSATALQPGGYADGDADGRSNRQVALWRRRHRNCAERPRDLSLGGLCSMLHP